MKPSFSEFLKSGIKDELLESKDVFPDVDVIKLDPDRVDAYDIVSALMPTLVRTAYVYLMEDKIKYERTHTDEEDTPFEFTEEALDERLEDLIGHVCKRFDDLSSSDRKSYIERVSKDFSEKLTEGMNKKEHHLEERFFSPKQDTKELASIVAELKNLLRSEQEEYRKVLKINGNHQTSGEAAWVKRIDSLRNKIEKLEKKLQ